MPSIAPKRGPSTAPPAGAIVEARGARWQLVERRTFAQCALVTLRGHDRQNLGETLRLLTPFDRLVAVSRAPRLRIAGTRAVARRVAEAMARAHPWHGCWTAAFATIDLLPWQLEPVLAVLAGATRVLLADEVGLGKTVQAGLILAELSARGLIDRTLILTPAGLRAQWAGELEARFGISAAVLDQAALSREAAWLPPGANPWATAAVVLSSIDLVKRADTLAAVDRVPFDLLIVDEAHHLTPESDRGALVARIAQRTPWVVLISATPHSGDARAFNFLRDIGDTPADRLTIFRRSAPQLTPSRRTHLVRVRTSPDERALLDEIQQYARAIWSARGATSAAARLVAIVLARRAASSADAVLASLVRRRQLMTDGTGPVEAPPEGRGLSPGQPSLPWEEVDGQDGDETDSLLTTLGLSSADDERRRLDRLIALARRARESATKPAWIARLIARAREPLIVFSEYRDTVEALRARFQSSVPLAVLHGGLSPSARRLATSSFVDGDAMLLLATDAGGEGLNLQARCRTVIDMELPWNPLRLEQRVGRVDRIGQRRRVHAMRLFHADSVEETVLAHLYRRRARVDAGLGAHEASNGVSKTTGLHLEAQVAGAVLGDSPASLTMPEWRSESVPRAEAETRRIETLRRLCRGQRADASGRCDTADVKSITAGDCVPVSEPRRSSGSTTGAMCAFEAALIDEGHRRVASLVVPISIALSRSLPRAPRDRLGILQAISAHVGAAEDVSAAIDELLLRDRTVRDEFGRAVGARVRALAHALRSGGERWHQPALFDHRSTRAAVERASVTDTHRAHLEHVASAVDGASGLTREPPRLLGVWVHR